MMYSQMKYMRRFTFQYEYQFTARVTGFHDNFAGFMLCKAQLDFPRYIGKVFSVRSLERVAVAVMYQTLYS